MPVMRVLPAQIAVRMSRPPPTPMTATPPRRIRYGSEVTSYCTQSSDAGSPSHLVITVPASPSMAATRHRALRLCGARRRAPEKRRTRAGRPDDHVGVRVPGRVVDRSLVHPQAAALRIDHAERTGGRRVRRPQRRSARRPAPAPTYRARPAWRAKHAAPIAARRAVASAVDVMSVRSSSQMIAQAPDRRRRAGQRRRACRSAPRVRVSASVTTTPDRTNGNRQHERRDRQGGELRWRAAANRRKRNDEIGDVRQREREGERQSRPPAGSAHGALRREDSPPTKHEHGAGRHAEHRDRHRQERQVIPGQHRQQPGVEHLEHQGGERDEEEAGGEPEDARMSERSADNSLRVYHSAADGWLTAWSPEGAVRFHDRIRLRRQSSCR